MRYNTLAHTNIKVSEICLGTMTYGEQNSEAEGHAQMDLAVDMGVNFIDTAEMYSIPPKAETYGRTEEIIGNWFKKKNCRNDIVLATKVIGKADDWMPHVRGGRARLNRDNITQALEQSLHRLQTEYIDLYQVHWPDRNTTFFGQREFQYQEDNSIADIEETLSVLNDLVASGKVRHIGVSNETPWGMLRYLHLSEQTGLTRVASIQNPYNLLNRSFEGGLSEICHYENIGLLAYSPLAFGVLSGKYLDGSAADNARLNLFPHYQRYNNDNAVQATQAYVALAKQYGVTPVQMALAFINHKSFVASNIVGATNLQQLTENINSSEVRLSKAILDEIDAIHNKFPNPCP